MRCYLAARYSRHEELRNYANQLEKIGCTVTSRWINGEHDAFDGELLGKLNREFARKCLDEDLQDLFAADTLIAFSEPACGGSFPCNGLSRGGRHVEFGIALALGKRIFVVGPVENIFHISPGVRHYETFDQVYLDLYVHVFNGELRKDRGELITNG